MSEPDPKIAELEARLDGLVRSQIDFQKEITAIRMALSDLRGPRPRTTEQTPPITTRLDKPEEPSSWVPPAFQRHTQPPGGASDSSQSVPPPTFGTRTHESTSESSASTGGAFSNYVSANAGAARSNLEKFIGENLISKIGIVILVLGVAIGAKYAIDNGWISPLMRIIFGYAMGLGLIAVAVRLKSKYHNFSAVLLSGGMAIMYFVTYFAYAYYALMPQSAAFVLMTIFTAFTVASAILYNRQVIAHIGLVGAYAVPFLLSDNSGNYLALFTYMAIINAGIMAISVVKYWRSLFYTSFVFTWLIFGSWFTARYDANEHFVLASVFASVFFAIFYGVAFGYRLVNNNVSMIENAGQVFGNSFVYYGFGYAVLDSRVELQHLEGLFTAAHALLHSAIAQIISRIRPNANDVVQVLAVLIITFTTIAIPVQFDGNYVTLIWTVEAAILFWFGRARQIPLFEYFSYPIMLFATGSLFLDWIAAYSERTSYVSEYNRLPLGNGEFVTALVFVAAFAFIHLTNRNENHEPAVHANFVRPFGYIVAVIALFVLYNTFRIEIGNYYHLQIAKLGGAVDSPIWTDYDWMARSDLRKFNVIWQLNYTMGFLIAMGLVNLRKVCSELLAYVNIVLGLLTLLVFATLGMGVFYELRESFMSEGNISEAGPFNIAIRYISYLFAAGLLSVLYLYSRRDVLLRAVPAKAAEIGYEAVLFLTVFIAASCELMNLMAQAHVPDASKLGLSILWGVYALMLIAIGIAKHKKHLRIAAFLLLAVTLIKLFLYDVADLPTIPKTILFVSLGLLLLLVSFLYNKYMNVIFPPPADQAD